MCDCPRCEFDRENGGISMGNEIGAIKALLVPGPDEQARAEVNANLNPPVLRNACTDLENESRLALLEARERAGHQILNERGAPLVDRRSGARLNVNGRMQDLLLERELEIERLTTERDRELNASYEYEQLYAGTVRTVLDLHEQLRQRSDDARSWARVADGMQQEIDFLTSGLQAYAPHAWNDIKRALKDKGWL